MTAVRGKSRQENWRRPDEIAVIVLELDLAADPVMRRRVEHHFDAAFKLCRALQHDARSLCTAYLAARHERKTAGPKAVRVRLGLDRNGIEARAKAHIERAGWMRAHLTKATGLHIADRVWESAGRFLFPDTSGRRLGKPRPGTWAGFTAIPGRARSHTKQGNAWETYRLTGTLQGHLDTYGKIPGLTIARAAALPPGTAVLAQPRHLRAPQAPKRAWSAHTGALTVTYTGLPGGDLVMPVRLPQGSGRFPRLAHFLANPEAWHKIDLDRSRRASNPAQYAGSRGQKARAGRRAAAGLPPRQIQVPRGARHASKAGQPLQSYRRDTLARGYRAVRADHAAAASAAARRKDASARQAALAIVAAHGSHMITEDVDIRLWALRWGRGIAAFTPGRLLAALERECQASGGYLARASTRRTALSQHCLCGARAKKNLSQRQHACACGAEGDRDLVSALLAACVTRTDTRDPKTARLDPALREHARTLVTAGLIKDVPVTGEEAAQQEGLPVRSTIRHNPGTGTGEDGSHPAVAPAGQGERPAQPRNRNHGRPWGQRRNRRTSRTPSDPQAASRLMDQLLGTEAFVRGDHDGEAAVRAAVEHLVHRVGDRHAGVRVGYHQ